MGFNDGLMGFNDGLMGFNGISWDVMNETFVNVLDGQTHVVLTSFR